MPKTDDLMTGPEAAEMILNFSCICGYKLNDSDQCFSEFVDGFQFECPRCEVRWLLRKAGYVN